MPVAPERPLDAALLERFLAGERVALARAISLVENLGPGFEALLHAVHGRLGQARRVGITGPPGAGKSTLAAELAVRYRRAGQTVGIVAVDPTSPFTGGAMLGDRIRMNELSTDPGVFIRSMATRGSLGGLATASKEVADLLDAFGLEQVLTETVGVGQSELDIAETADTTVVVLVPESGDSVQAMKAGLMEIADIFVVNKADRPGADRLAQDLEAMLQMRPAGESRAAGRQYGVGRGGDSSTTRIEVDKGGEGWVIPVLKTVGGTGEGVEDLVTALQRHVEYLDASGELARRRHRRHVERTRAAVDRHLRLLVWRDGAGERMLAEGLPRLESGEESPYSLAARIVRAIVATDPPG